MVASWASSLLPARANLCNPPRCQVIIIEEEWGDWLVTQKQMDAAINHFIESGATLKAIKAAIDCRQFAKAAGIIEVLVSARLHCCSLRVGPC